MSNNENPANIASKLSGATNSAGKKTLKSIVASALFGAYMLFAPPVFADEPRPAKPKPAVQISVSSPQKLSEGMLSGSMSDSADISDLVAVKQSAFKPSLPDYFLRDSLSLKEIAVQVKGCGERNLKAREAYMFLFHRELHDKSKSMEEVLSRIDSKYGASINKAAKKYKVNSDLLESMIYCGSTGNKNCGATDPTPSAKGLCHFTSEAALAAGLRVDLEESYRLTQGIIDLEKRIRKEHNKDKKAKLSKLIELKAQKRMNIDQRFNPYKSIDAAAKRLKNLTKYYGRSDFAVCAFSMPKKDIDDAIIEYLAGNISYNDIKKVFPVKKSDLKKKLSKNDLGYVISKCGKKGMSGIRRILAATGVTYNHLFFDCAPFTSNPGTYKTLYGRLNYARNWQPAVEEARRIIGSYHSKDGSAAKKEFRKKDRLYHGKPKSKGHAIDRASHLKKEITAWYFPGTIKPYNTLKAVSKAFASKELVSMPNDPKFFGYKVASDIGEGNGFSSHEKKMLRTTRPETLGVLILFSYLARAESGINNEYLIMTSAVRPSDYQRKISSSPHYSTHPFARGFDLSPCTSNGKTAHAKSGKYEKAFRYAKDILENNNHMILFPEGNHGHCTLNSDKEVVKFYRGVYKEAMKQYAASKMGSVADADNVKLDLSDYIAGYTAQSSKSRKEI